jgi:osmotically inducible protein OsmC
MAKSTAKAHWESGIMSGSGSVSTTSPALKDTHLTFKARLGEEAGTTPEELLASGHAGCYAMALTGALEGEGHTPTSIDVSATYEFGPIEGGFAIKGVVLTVEGDVPGVDEATFLQVAEGAKDGCPVSKAIAGNVPISLEAKLTANA